MTSKIANAQTKEKIMYLGDSDNDNPAFTKADVSIGVRSDDRLKPKLSCTNILKFDVLSTFLKRFMENNFLFSDTLNPSSQNSPDLCKLMVSIFLSYSA